MKRNYIFTIYILFVTCTNCFLHNFNELFNRCFAKLFFSFFPKTELNKRKSYVKFLEVCYIYR